MPRFAAFLLSCAVVQPPAASKKRNSQRGSPAKEQQRGSAVINVLFVGLGGFVGAILRYLLGLIPVRQTPFPIITLCINVLGAFGIGLLAALCERHKINSQPLLLFLKVGLCGGFTTFSTFSLETYDLLSSGRTVPAILYALLSVGLCLLAIFGARALIH